MPVELHIRRPADQATQHTPDSGRVEPDEEDDSFNTITLAEWATAVRGCSSVRLATGDATATLPNGVTLRVKNTGGDTEVFFPLERTWHRVFYWSPSGSITFNLRAITNDPEDPVLHAAEVLAKVLRAVILTDEGEPFE